MWAFVIVVVFLFPGMSILPCQARPPSSLLDSNQLLSVVTINVNADNDNELVEPPLPPNSTIPSNITVGAYYYPWHAGDFHRGQGYLRKVLEPPQSPMLGEYDDRTNQVIGQHLTWSRQANIQLWVSSWWGAGSREDLTLKNLVLTHPDLRTHNVALFYETTGRVKESEGFDLFRVAGDITYMCQNYFTHKNYYRIQGRPVLFLYLTRRLSGRTYDDGRVVLTEFIQLMRETAKSLSTCNTTELYIIGDQAFGEAPTLGSEYAPFLHLDAVTNYDVYGNIASPTPYAGLGLIAKYYQQQAAWKVSANASGVSFVPVVSPGYNDRGVRLAANHLALSRRLSPEAPEGSALVSQLLLARGLVDDGADRLLMVNSFNEWHEDTQIEPVTIAPATTQPNIYTNGVAYVGYGELYLDILREGTLCQGINCSTHNDTTGGDGCPINNSTTTNCTNNTCAHGSSLYINETICDGGARELPPLLLSPTLGSTSRVLDNATTMQIVNRRSTYHGVQVDLSSRVLCIMQRNQTYLLSFGVRIVRQGMENVLVDCSSLGERCLQIFTDFLPGCNNPTIQSHLIYEAPPFQSVLYGEWTRVQVRIVFTTDELDPMNAFLTLRIGGGETGVDIEIRNVSFHKEGGGAAPI